MRRKQRRQRLMLLIVTAIAVVSSYIMIYESIPSLVIDAPPRELARAPVRIGHEGSSVTNPIGAGKYRVQGTLQDLVNTAEGESSSATTTYTDLIRDNKPLPQYSVQNAIDASEIYYSKFGLLRYDPTTNKFTGYYFRKHEWQSGAMKLANSITVLTSMLRSLFPERFTPNSPEFVMAVSSGDYSDVAYKYQSCVQNGEDGPCDESLLTAPPVLHFGSVFRQPHFPNLIAMPMPGDHLNCFKVWNDLKHRNDGRRICDAFRSSTEGGWLSTNNLAWDDLIPQLIWRGTDFPFLEKLNSLRQPRWETYITGPVRSHPHPNEAATTILRKDYQKFVPRWKGVIHTAESEIEASRTNALPRINIKFTSVTGAGKRIPANIEGVYRGWKEVGFPVAGDTMTIEELSKYKYHIDLGGGGGTTWTGTLQKLFMPGLLFHHVTPTKDYIHDYIRPWVHYVPVRSDLEDLLDKLEWAESHPEEARQISENATKFVKELGTLDGFAQWFESNMFKPLQMVIEAYTPPSGNEEEELNALLQRKLIWPFLECTAAGCQRLGRANWGMHSG